MSQVISDQQAEELMASRQHPRVTLESIEGRVAEVSFTNNNQLTICVVTMQNGYMVVGKSAPASPENFNLELGQKFSHDDCIRQLFALEGYLLCQRQSEAPPEPQPSSEPAA